MGRRKIEEHQVQNLMKTAGGSTYIVSLPKEIIRELKWQARQKLVVTKHQDGIIIRDWKKN
jgi:Antidote-toxin recognition MazE, bacterial antitoxin